VSPANLKSEIEAAKTARERQLAVFDDLVRQRSGTAYRDWRAKTGDQPPEYPENHIHEFLSITTPKLVFDNPAVSVTSRKRGSPTIVAMALEAALNDWVDRVRLYKTLNLCANDLLMMWSAAKVIQAPQPDTDQSYGAPHWPVVQRIPQRRFIMDPLCLCPEEAKYKGEQIFRNKDDLLEEAKDPMSGWNVQAIQNLATDVAPNRTTRAGDEARNPIKRNEVSYYEIWVPDAVEPGMLGPDAGYHGYIYTIGDGQAEYLREPREFYGPPNGPYYMAGVHIVTDSPWPLSPLVAVYSQMDELNAQARAVSLGNRHYKRIVFCDGTDPALVAQLKSGKHDFVVPLRAGLEKGSVIALEIGGATENQIRMMGILAERLDRVSGIQDAQRGDIPGGTATEVAVADQASETRMAHCKRVFSDHVTEILRGVAWYLCHDDRVVVPMGDDFANQNSMIDPVFFGGPYAEDGGASFDDLELEIQAYSMERTGEAMMQRNAMQMFQLVTTSLPIVAQFPMGADWKLLFDNLGHAMNCPDLGKVVNVDALTEIAGMPAVNGPHPNPKMGRQLGAPTLPPGGPGAKDSMPYVGNLTGQAANPAPQGV